MNNTQEIKLVLEDGQEFIGKTFGAETSISGEVVFSTAMTGYPESLTDPSYKGQILVLTYPLIGNYGTPGEDKENELLSFFESHKIHISGLIISDYSFNYSHWNAESSLAEWLRKNNIPAMYAVDTREITKILREKGSMLGKIVYNNNDIEYYNPNEDNLVAQVSIDKKQVYGNGQHKVLLIDCGVKYNIIRCLLDRDTTVIRVPWDYDYTQEDYDGLFISNGPGDPKKCDVTIQNLKKSFEGDKPIFGICLGNQLLGLASGGDTFKLKYGHRSHNQPVLLSGTDRAFVTSQNHGYALDGESLTSDWEPLFTNINDGTIEGIKHKSKPFFSSQFHPEASSGPVDTEYLFDEFIENIKTYKNCK